MRDWKVGSGKNPLVERTAYGHSLRENQVNKFVVFGKVGSHDPIGAVPNTRVLLIGGKSTEKASKQLIIDTPRNEFEGFIPGGISAHTHTVIRKWFGLSRASM